VYHIIASSADTIWAFNMGFDNGNVHRPTVADDTECTKDIAGSTAPGCESMVTEAVTVAPSTPRPGRETVPVMYWRKLNLKAELESSLSYYSLKP